MQIPKIISDTAYSKYEAKLEREVLAGGNLPRHIAIIMDGNRRYAREVLNSGPEEGHIKGKEKLEEVLDWCIKLDIKVLTAYAFSTENFSRGGGEVGFLMDLMKRSLLELADDERVHSHRIRVRILGDRSMLPPDLLEAAEHAERRTAAYSDFQFNLAIAYGARQEILSAVRELARKVRDGEMEPEDIDERALSFHMYTTDIPDPDLVLRTSGELRVSNFLLWQMAYAELYFTDVYWPGFRYIDFLRAVRSYQQRKRKYGR